MGGRDAIFCNTRFKQLFKETLTPPQSPYKPTDATMGSTRKSLCPCEKTSDISAAHSGGFHEELLKRGCRAFALGSQLTSLSKPLQKLPSYYPLHHSHFSSCDWLALKANLPKTPLPSESWAQGTLEYPQTSRKLRIVFRMEIWECCLTQTAGSDPKSNWVQPQTEARSESARM